MEKRADNLVKILEASLLLGVIVTSGCGFRYYRRTYTSPYRSRTSSLFYHKHYSNNYKFNPHFKKPGFSYDRIPPKPYITPQSIPHRSPIKRPDFRKTPIKRPPIRRHPRRH
jgi:hypothetical protein